jgi:TPR repeat protein
MKSQISYLSVVCLLLLASPYAWAKGGQEDGFSRAMSMLMDNKPSPKKVEQSTDLLRKEAEKGNIDAAYNLGVALYTNNKTPEGRSEAVKWFKKASEAGDARAEFNLATAYEDSTRLPVAPDVVVSLYQQAAMQGIIESMHRLGVILTSGEYGRKDKVSGLSWLYLAQGYEDQDLKQDMKNLSSAASPGELIQAQDMAEKRRTELEKNPTFLSNMNL